MTRIHEEQPIATAGELLVNANAAMIMVHGRGGTNHSALSLVDFLSVDGFAYLAPQAANHTWYPYSFMMPRAQNEPHLSSALDVIDSLVQEVRQAGIRNDKIMLLGFSQGACLASEYVARNPTRFGGLMVLSGGLIGADGELTGYEGTLDNTPVFLGCSDVDSHIPVERVHESAAIFESLGAAVEKRIYPGMGHTIIQDEFDYVKSVMNDLIT